MRWSQIEDWPADLVAAFGLLTRLPLPKRIQGSAIGRGVWAWPLVGLVVGAIGAGVYALAFHWRLSPWLGGMLAVLVMAVATGALHEDGLADTADGIGGGGTAERRLAIMRDSRIGGYGALTLIGSVGLRVGAVAQLAEPRLVAPALIVMAVLGRAACPGVLLLSSGARPSGLAARLGAPDHTRIGAGWVIAVVICLILARPHHVLAAILAATVIAYGMAVLGRRTLGGYTGDTLGATEQLTECAVLLVLAAMAGA